MTAADAGTPTVPRVLILVCDSFGVGEAPDADAYGDAGSDTLGQHGGRGRRAGRAEPVGRSGSACSRRSPGSNPRRRRGRRTDGCTERSAGKDTTTGHWEMTGIVLDEPFPLYPNGFPPEVIEPFEAQIGRRGPGQRPGVGDRDHR